MNDMNSIICIMRQQIVNNGQSKRFVAERSNISYQRLQRIFNQGAVMSATEFLRLCKTLKLDPMLFYDDQPKAG